MEVEVEEGMHILFVLTFILLNNVAFCVVIMMLLINIALSLFIIDENY